MRKVVVNDRMQRGYTYTCSEPAGKNFDKAFQPELTPREMLALGVFGGVYMRDCKAEFPEDWFKTAKFAADKSDKRLNYFGVAASQPLRTWQEKGWLSEYDPRGWFQWYCRYYMGRRIPDEDQRQIKRWKAFRRHTGQIEKNCMKGDLSCRRRQRQALLHWAYDSRKI